MLQKGFGLADLEEKTPVTPDTRFRAASVSKLITVTALGKLVQEGRLDLDTPIARYLAKLEGALPFPGADQITARQLAGHLSGVGHYQKGDKIARFKQYDSVAESLAAFRDSPRVGQPSEA